MDLDVDTWQVGHLIGRADGGGHTPANLEAECPPCNQGDGGRVGARRRAAARHAPYLSAQRLRSW
jgi:5-methylcytosine-specific restriction endonuclease McrA